MHRASGVRLFNPPAASDAVAPESGAARVAVHDSTGLNMHCYIARPRRGGPGSTSPKTLPPSTPRHRSAAPRPHAPPPYTNAHPAAGDCESGDLRRYMLKPIREMPFIGLLEHLRNISKVGQGGPLGV